MAMLTGVPEINQKEYVNELDAAIREGDNLLVFAKAGSGKTEIAKQRIKAAGYGCLYLNLSTLEAADLVGLPSIDKATKSFEYIPPPFLPVKGRVVGNQQECVLLVDEIDKAARELQNPMLEIAQFRTINGQPLNIRAVIATGNLPDEGAFSKLVSHAFTNRCSVFKMDSDFPAWKEWAISAGLNSLVIGFLDQNANLLFGSPDKASNGDPTAYCRPSARSWTEAARKLDACGPDASLDTMVRRVASKVGISAAGKFEVWLKHYKHLQPQIDALVKKGKAPKLNDMAEMFVFAISATSQVVKAMKECKPDNIKPAMPTIDNVLGWLDTLAPEVKIAAMRNNFDPEFGQKYELHTIPMFKQVYRGLNEITQHNKRDK